MSTAPSLRRSLLQRLALPLAILALVSGLIAVWLAWQYTEVVVDRSLDDLAGAIVEQVRIYGKEAHTTVPVLAKAMFSDPADELVYRIVDGQTEVAGSPDLPINTMPACKGTETCFFNTGFEHSAVRSAQIRLVRPGHPDTIVEVGQRAGRRYWLAAEFMVAIMVPLLTLLVAGALIIWHGVHQQLDPLQNLADSLNRQTYTSLEPVDETEVPAEIRPLTGALNALLDRLKVALEGQRKFITDAAHQLRTPLTAVKLHAEQAAAARDETMMLAAVKELRASANRAVRLSNQLLSLARAEPGEQRARFVPIDLSTLAFETGAEWVPRALARDIDLGFEPSANGPGPLYVRGNPVLLREALANLIDNALKYVPPHRGRYGRVTINVTRIPMSAGEQAEISVDDNGPGVPKPLQRDLFERFFRGDGSTEHEAGAGLGLAIVRDIVRLHGGTVYYRDNPFGGSRFVICLPLSEADVVQPKPA